MAKANPSWGYTRIVGALANLGHEVARATVAEMLARHGIAPSPVRNSKTTWRQFLRSHWSTLAAAEVDNGLCEANETCVYSPNLGGYQGHGLLIPTGPFVPGVVSGVTLLRHADNGR